MSLEGRSFDLANAATLRPLLGREVAAVFQNPSGMLDPLLRIERQLVEAVVRHKQLTAPAAVDRARKLLRDVGFRDVDRVMRAYPHELSGGMSQRVAIVMALMSGPKLLVVDEPTSALDANVRVEVMERLSRLAKEEGAAVLLVSHDLGLISRFCDEITVLYGGHVMEQGPARDVVVDPAHPYTRALLSCAPDWHRPARLPLTTIEGKPPLPGAWPGVCIFSPRCPVVCERGLMERPALMSVGSRECACFRAVGQPTATQGSRS
jgi:oligopeptide/dipeptide ABC transporter ATP-binding protein